MKTVYIVDDHSAIREGFKVILERSGRYTCLGEAGTGEEALAYLCLEVEAPQLYIVDISLPGMSGLDLTEKLLRTAPGSPVVVVSMHRAYDYITGAFRAGALAYVAKDSGLECVIAALDAAGAGACYLDPASLKVLVQGACLNPAKAATVRTEISGLSDREIDVLRLLAGGKRAEEIAAALEVSQKTNQQAGRQGPLRTVPARGPAGKNLIRGNSGKVRDLLPGVFPDKIGKRLASFRRSG
jgi:DNA-binding NarL/FixJ family response regulator